MRRSTIVQIVCAGTMLGIVAGGSVSWMWVAVGAAAIVGIGILVRRSTLRLYGVACVAIILGVVRWQMAIQPGPNDVSRFIQPSAVSIAGTVNAEPDPVGDNQRFVLNSVEVSGRDVDGLIRVTTGRYPPYEAGQRLSFSCKLESVSGITGEASFRRQGIEALCSRPAGIRVVERSARSVRAYLFRFRVTLERTVRSIFPEPQAALLEGLLWGSRSGLPDSVQNDFKRSGMSHQVAVSGFNTTIIAAFLSALLFRLGLNRTSVLVASCFGLASFVIISGASAAVVRAAFMSLSVLVARWLGRPAAAGHTLIVVAAAMVLANPWLIYDIGFQLSAAATAGLVYLSPMFEPWLKWLPEKMGLRENMATTLAATFTTLPVTIGHFGQFSIISPLANALTLPLLPLTMAIGGVAVGLGLLWTTLGSAAALVAWLPLSYLLAVPHLFGSIGWAAVTLRPVGWLAIFMYAPIAAILVQRKTKTVCPLSVG